MAHLHLEGCKSWCVVDFHPHKPDHKETIPTTRSIYRQLCANKYRNGHHLQKNVVTDVRNFVSLPNAVKYWQQVQSTHHKETIPTNRSVYITDVRVLVPQTYKKAAACVFI